MVDLAWFPLIEVVFIFKVAFIFEKFIDNIQHYSTISDNIYQYNKKSRDLTISENIRQSWAVFDTV